MLEHVFQQRGAYPYPFGSDNLGWLYEASDAALERLSLPRLRDQAVAVDVVFAEWKGRYLALQAVCAHQGATPYLDAEMARVKGSLLRIQGQQRRLRARLDAAPQPRWQAGRN